MTTLLSRYTVYFTVFMLVLYDMVCELRGWTTLSAAIRQIDNDIAGLLRWLLLGLWFHWFVGLWPTPRI